MSAKFNTQHSLLTGVPLMAAIARPALKGDRSLPPYFEYLFDPESN